MNEKLWDVAKEAELALAGLSEPDKLSTLRLAKPLNV